MNDWIRRWYGAGPLHLVAVAAGLTVSIFALSQLFPRDPVAVGVWLIGGPLLHDLVLVPAYSAAFLLLLLISGRIGSARALNHIRVPTLLSGLLFLVFFPLILRRPSSFEGITGFSTDPYLGRWLGLSLGFYLISAMVFLVKSRHGDSVKPGP